MINSEIPLLLSKRAMKKAEFLLDFKEDMMSVFSKRINLQCTHSGNYLASLTKHAEMASNASDILFIKKIADKLPSEKRKIAEKLQKQFSHLSHNKLLTHVKDSSVIGKEFLEIVGDVSSNCEIRV